MKAPLLLTATSVLAACLLIGCGEEKPIELVYDRPAQQEVSPTIRKLAIAEFGGPSAQDKTWGAMAADKLASALDDYNHRFNRYELVDRMRLKAIVDERDLQIMISNPSEESARKVGQLAKVDAMVYGTVRTVCKDEHLTRSVIDPLQQTTKTVPYIRRSCTVSVSFFMDDIGTGKVIVSKEAEHGFDSDKQKKSGGEAIASVMGIGGDKLPPTDQIVTDLIDQCVSDFLAKFSPHQVRETIVPEKGKSKFVESGNKFLHAGEYKDALECYQQGLQAVPDDAGAAFNAGVASEALRDFAQSEQYYNKACHLDSRDKYIVARKRVRAEASGGPGPAAQPAPGAPANP